MKPRGALLAVVLLAQANPVFAQCPPVCIDPKTGQVIINPPPVHVDPPPVHVDPPPIHVNPPPYTPPTVDLEAQRIAQWRIYFEWEAKIRLDVDAQIQATVRAQGRAAAEATPDPWRYRPLGGYGAHPDATVTYPFFDIGLLGVCVAVFQGPGRPGYGGFCLPLGIRLNPDWAIRMDPSFVWESHTDIDFHSFGLHPAVTWAYARGRGRHAASHAYLRAGFDMWLPIDGGRASPDAFGGLHAGAGAEWVEGPLGIGAEVRALARAGFGPSDERMGRLRAGVEARVYALSLAF